MYTDEGWKSGSGIWMVVSTPREDSHDREGAEANYQQDLALMSNKNKDYPHQLQLS